MILLWIISHFRLENMKTLFPITWSSSWTNTWNSCRFCILLFLVCDWISILFASTFIWFNIIRFMFCSFLLNGCCYNALLLGWDNLLGFYSKISFKNKILAREDLINVEQLYTSYNQPWIFLQSLERKQAPKKKMKK